MARLSRLSIEIAPEVLEKLRAIAAKTGRKQRAIVENAIRKELARLEELEAKNEDADHVQCVTDKATATSGGRKAKRGKVANPPMV
ncbi:MAG: hypothetical protein D6750_10155 [Bacteroidetes bacterium]|nr:MAG: hypothetical protein D6750_10155 [Bacteroidota bacterium]